MIAGDGAGETALRQAKELLHTWYFSIFE
jgi:hypothetical protein